MNTRICEQCGLEFKSSGFSAHPGWMQCINALKARLAAVDQDRADIFSELAALRAAEPFVRAYEHGREITNTHWDRLSEAAKRP